MIPAVNWYATMIITLQGGGSVVEVIISASEYFLIVDGYGSSSGSYQRTVDFESVLDSGIYGNVSGSCGGPPPENVYMLLYVNSCGSSDYLTYAMSAADGSYSFTGLLNGNYTVRPLKRGTTFHRRNKF